MTASKWEIEFYETRPGRCPMQEFFNLLRPKIDRAIAYREEYLRRADRGIRMKLEEYRKQLARDPEYLAAQEELRPLLELADTVLSQRLARDWSQAELAERVGTRQANISRLESGLSNPSIKFLQRLAEALDAKLIIHLEPRAAPLPPDVLITAFGHAAD